MGAAQGTADAAGPARSRLGRGRRAVLVVGAVLALIVLVFAVRRVVTDVPNLGRPPAQIDAVDRAYGTHPWLTYLHIVPGVIYLLGASLQLSYWFRSRHYTFHRRLGRVVLASGLLAGAFAILVGVRFAFGGLSETVATVLFGAWFLTCLCLAFAAIRRGDMVTHRRWMIRAFAVGIAVGTIRIWIGVLAGPGFTSLSTGFAIGFWLAFVMHVLVAEWWVRTSPVPTG